MDTCVTADRGQVNVNPLVLYYHLGEKRGETHCGPEGKEVVEGRMSSLVVQKHHSSSPALIFSTRTHPSTRTKSHHSRAGFHLGHQGHLLSLIVVLRVGPEFTLILLYFINIGRTV